MSTATEAPAGFGPVFRGVGAGLIAGAVWWTVEWVANWALGGVLPLDASVAILGLDLAVGAVAGLATGLAIRVLGRGDSPLVFALALACVYGGMLVYAPPGMRAEGLFLAVAIASGCVAVWLAGSRQGAFAFVHLTVVMTLAIVLGKLAVSQAQSTYFGHGDPKGPSLPLALAVLPLVGLVVDRVVGALIRMPGIRALLEVAVVLAAAVMWGNPQAVAPLLLAETSASPIAGAPDVILISLDTTRADHMSTYGYERNTTPELTELAADALNFTQARSPAEWTVPGHASMFTGLFPSRHGAHYSGGWAKGPAINGRRRVFPLAERHVTLAEALREHGYATGGFVANFANLYRGFGMAQGFARYEDHPYLLLRPAPHVVRLLQQFDPSVYKKPFRSAEQLNDAALRFIDDTPEGRPAFIFLNYLEPHHWLSPPPFDEWTRDLPGAAELYGKGLFTHAIPAGLTEEERAFVVGTYDGQIRAMDVALGQLVAALKERKRYENTILIVTADHGELLGEHDQVGHGGRMLYEGLLHVPLVVKLAGPDRPRGVVDTPVQVVDIVPTVLAALGLESPAEVQGQPLQRVTHESLAEEHINPELVAHYGDVYNRAMRVLYEDQYKLITTSRGQRMLFDLSRDPLEKDNLAEREPERVARMERRLEESMSRMRTNEALAARTP